MKQEVERPRLEVVVTAPSRGDQDDPRLLAETHAVLGDCVDRLECLLQRYRCTETRAELLFLQSELEAVRGALSVRFPRC